MEVSMVVPFYKGNEHMERIFSIARKNAEHLPEGELELILVNDSPQEQIRYQESWVRGFSLKILVNPQNTGIHGSRRNGIREARGQYIQMLDQDDLLADDAIACHLAAIGNGDVCVANGTEECGAHSGPIYESVSQQKMALQMKYYYSIGCMIISPGQCLIRKDSIPSVWLERPIRCNGADDLLLWLLMLSTGSRWTLTPRKLYTHVSTGVNLSSDFFKMKESAGEVKNFLKAEGLLSRKQEKIFDRRFEMRERYLDNRRSAKLAGMLAYPDLAWALVLKKLRGKL